MCNAFCRCMGSVSCTESIVYIEVTIRSELFCKRGTILLFIRIESDVLKKKNFTWLKSFDFLLDFFSDYIWSKLYRLTEKLLEFSSDRSHGEIHVLLSLWSAIVAHDNKGSTAIENIVDCRKSSLDSCSICYYTILYRNIEVHSDKNSFTLKVSILNCIKYHIIVLFKKRPASSAGPSILTNGLKISR